MKLDRRTMRLIAVGASITANCLPCLQINLVEAQESGANDQEIADAIEIGKMVRQGVASNMDDFVMSLSHAVRSIEGGGCGCGSQTTAHDK